MDVPLIQSIYRAFGEGDIDAVLDALASKVEWRTPATLPWSAGTYRGRDGVATYLQAFSTAIDGGKVEPESFLDAGDAVVVHGWERGTARPTRRSFGARFAHTWRIDGGRVVAMEGIVDTAAITAAFDPT